MISIEEFLAAVGQLLNGLNEPQERCVKHGTDVALMIVAGPGSGKTRVLVLRALRHVFVDRMPPEEVLITTFTRKAAAEISSRLIGWGLRLAEHFTQAAIVAGDVGRQRWLATLDINAIQAGTLDSFCQRWLSATRQVGQPAPVMLEQFAADFVYARKVFGPTYRNGGEATLKPYLQQFNFGQDELRSQGEAARVSTTVNNRIVQDLVDVNALHSSGRAQELQAQLLQDYRTYLQSQHMYDFALCAERILAGLSTGNLYRELTPVSAILVDEYQDTNPLQEAIYFALAKVSGAAFSVVGDDDQALYRFRGATVELFTEFRSRYAAAVRGQTELVYLVTNHRSSPEIVKFFNSFASFDPEFQGARVAEKPAIKDFNASRDIPVLGMFRDSLEDLANDLTDLLADVFQGSGRHIPGTTVLLKKGQPNGAIGDAVLLASTVREFKPDSRTGGLTACLPSLIRGKLEARGSGVFNPRGQDLRDIARVGQLLGLVALCLDDTDSCEQAMTVTGDAKRYIAQWRQQANQFIESSPLPHSPTGSLHNYVTGWRTRKASRGDWPSEIPLLDLLYKLIVWMPDFQNDPEHQVYLEAIMRCVSQGANFSSYGFSIIEKAPHHGRSREAVFRDLLAAVADKVVDIDEDLLFAIPRHRLSVMTIHQSKGLEFPLVIVDVGSEFKMDHSKQRFKRFPESASATVEMESGLAPFTDVGALRTSRADLQRTFDDLTRLYYVAYSRPQTVLLLVGLRKNIEYNTKIKNVATFWRRDESWAWRKDNPGLRRGAPTTPENMPLKNI